VRGGYRREDLPFRKGGSSSSRRRALILFFLGGGGVVTLLPVKGISSLRRGRKEGSLYDAVGESRRHLPPPAVEIRGDLCNSYLGTTKGFLLHQGQAGRTILSGFVWRGGGVHSYAYPRSEGKRGKGGRRFLSNFLVGSFGEEGGAARLSHSQKEVR